MNRVVEQENGIRTRVSRNRNVISWLQFQGL